MNAENTIGAVKLSYVDEGNGPVMLFLHGGGCNRQFWSPQLEHFRGRFRVIAPDLRGHGESPAPEGNDDNYTIAAHASDVAALCEALSVDNAIVMGHSHGGLLAFSLPALYPGLASRVIALDAPLLFPEEMLGPFRAFANSDLSNFNTAANQVADLLLGQYLDPGIRSQIDAAVQATNPQVMISMSRDVFGRSHEEVFAQCDVPALCLDAVQPNDYGRLAALCAHFSFGRVVGSGHFLQLEVPAQLHAMVDRFLEVT